MEFTAVGWASLWWGVALVWVEKSCPTGMEEHTAGIMPVGGHCPSCQCVGHWARSGPFIVPRASVYRSGALHPFG